jgi:hypothetical protein
MDQVILYTQYITLSLKDGPLDFSNNKYSMSYLNKMYGSRPQQSTESNKNPNRVMGGLRAQGVDSYKILGEDGVEKEIPTQSYVRALEDKLRKLDARLTYVEKLNKRNANDIRVAEAAITRKNNS